MDVLKAATQSHAPLSQAQTFQIFQTLQDLNAEAMRQIKELRYETQLSGDGQGDVRMELSKLNAANATMQQELVKTNSRISALRVDVLGNAANVVVLQQQAEKATDGLSQFKEGQKVTNTNVHNLREDFLLAKEEITKMQKDVADLKVEKKNVLGAKLDRAVLAIQQTQGDLEALKTVVFQSQDHVHEIRESLGETQGDVTKLESAKESHDKRIMDVVASSSKTKESLEMTNGVVMKLHSEHEETRKKALEVHDKAHDLDTSIMRLRNDHSHIVQSVKVVNQEAAKLQAAHATTREQLVEVTGTVGGSNSGIVNLQNAVHELGKNIELVHSVAAHTQEHLKMTNALVLPNLGSDGAISPSSLGNTQSSGFATVNAMNSARGMNETTSPRGSARTSRSSTRRYAPPRALR